MRTAGPLSISTDRRTWAVSASTSASEWVMCASRKSRVDTASSRPDLALFQSPLMKGWPAFRAQSSRHFWMRAAYSGRATRPVNFRSTLATRARGPGSMAMSQVSPPTSVPGVRVTVGVK
ncbi:Uncharacterised protein [Bordetella pertussis]|nr:Uncharacterised protein [Bordetella pertussis]CFE03728.1 Uncharacterised protein [Bordetella pertussis]CFL85194.1 Uncharacterised protein [Bordetella pertussis]CFL96051.1 Uncharacterised protein [Bordetella pertussis]CFL98975.1 Uncharacterised protein [Bordetella pertussis]